MVGSYLQSPLYQQMLAQTMQGGPSSQYPGQAVANGLAQALQAWNLQRFTDKQEAKEKSGNAELAKALLPEQFRDAGNGQSYDMGLSGGGSISGKLPNIQDGNAGNREQLAALLNGGALNAESLAPMALKNLGLGGTQGPIKLGKDEGLYDPSTYEALIKPRQAPVSLGRDSRLVNPDSGAEIAGMAPPEVDYNKAFLPDGSPNTAFQNYQAQIADAGRQMTPYQQQSLALQRQTAQGGGAVPSGYMRLPDGTGLTHIPGGPADPAVAGRGTGKPTEDQAKNAQLYTLSKQMLPQVLSNFEELGGAGNAIGNTIGNLPFVGPGSAMTTSSGYQQAENGLNALVANFLYSTSGATATPDEVKNRAATVRPRVGDSPETLALKKKALTEIVESMKLRASPQLLQQQPNSSSSGGWGIRRLP